MSWPIIPLRFLGTRPLYLIYIASFRNALLLRLCFKTWCWFFFQTFDLEEWIGNRSSGVLRPHWRKRKTEGTKNLPSFQNAELCWSKCLIWSHVLCENIPKLKKKTQQCLVGPNDIKSPFLVFVLKVTTSFRNTQCMMKSQHTYDGLKSYDGHPS